MLRRVFAPASNASVPQESIPSALERRLFLALAAAALVYAFLAGLRTVTDYDLGWQLATGRWVAQHHEVPSTDVFSYTAQGQPWIYPVGSGLLFYASYLLGKYVLLSWLGAAVCVGAVALLLRRGSVVSAVLAILAVPLIATRTTPRAEMFTVLLFAAFLSLLWQQQEEGDAPLWLLPLLMAAWVNLHLGFLAGLALLAGYVLVEGLKLVWPLQRHAATKRLRRAWPWFLATILATFVNPWGWGIYRALFRQEAAMAAHSQSINEWASVPQNWTLAAASLSLRSADGAFFVLLLLVVVAVPVAIFRRQLGAAALLIGGAVLGLRHMRLQVLFAVITVIVAGAIFASLLEALKPRIADMRIRSMIAVGATALVLLLVCVRSVDLVTNRTYLEGNSLATLGTGLSWWFPEDAAAFIERESIPPQLFNDYNEGGFIAWRLGPKYLDYIDGRAIPFGAARLQRTNELMHSPPDSPEWQREAERYNINTIILPLGRYDALQFFSVLPEFCASTSWRPVYLDEVSVVFVRRTPETEGLIRRNPIDCATARLPAVVPTGSGSKAFNQWANAAAVLRVLGRNSEAFAATTQALKIFPDSAFVHFTRAILFEHSGNFQAAEPEYLLSAALQPAAVAPWATLAACYQKAGQRGLAMEALERAAALSPRPWVFQIQLGYDYLEARRPHDALKAFDRAARSLPSQSELDPTAGFRSGLARGRAISWSILGDSKRATDFEEEAVRLSPDSYEDWVDLANLYQSQGRFAEAQHARERAAALNAQQSAYPRQ